MGSKETRRHLHGEEIVRVWIIMARKSISHSDTVTKDLQRASCLDKHCPKAVLHVEGRQVKAAELSKRLRAHAELITRAAAARAKWIAAVAQQRALAEELKPEIAVAAHYVTNTFGTGSEAFIDFGLADQAATPQTVETKALAVEKRDATRKARHTMGKTQKLKIHGDVVKSDATAPVAAVTPDATTNGTSAPQQAATPVTQANGVAH
jgi:hypothetical protein